MSLLTRLFLLVVIAAAARGSLTAQQPPTPPKTGPVLLAGDLYHYPEEITTGRTPSFEWNAEQPKATRAKIAAFPKQTNAQMWIEHDMATHAKLPKAPAYVE